MDDALGFAGTSEFEINPDAVTKVFDLLFKLGPAEREGGAVKPRYNGILAAKTVAAGECPRKLSF